MIDLFYKEGLFLDLVVMATLTFGVLARLTILHREAATLGVFDGRQVLMKFSLLVQMQIN